MTENKIKVKSVKLRNRREFVSGHFKTFKASVTNTEEIYYGYDINDTFNTIYKGVLYPGEVLNFVKEEIVVFRNRTNEQELECIRDDDVTSYHLP